MERNITLDWFKVFLSILIILLHLSPLFGPTHSGTIIQEGIARIAVPCFFIIGGYYSVRLFDNQAKLWKYLRHLFILYIVWELIYLPSILSEPHRLINLLFGYIHLWYVPSLFGGILLLFLLKKCKITDSLLFVIAIALFLIGYIIQYKVNSTIGWLNGWFLYRNFLFSAFPFIFLGYYIRVHTLTEKLSRKFIYLTIIISFVLLYVEAYTPLMATDLQLSNLILCPAIFIAILQNSKYGVGNGYLEHLSGGIYFTHIFAIELALSMFNASNSILIIYLPVILFVDLLIVIVLIKANKYVKIFL